MRILVEKFPNGYEGWVKEKGEHLGPQASARADENIIDLVQEDPCHKLSEH